MAYEALKAIATEVAEILKIVSLKLKLTGNFQDAESLDRLAALLYKATGEGGQAETKAPSDSETSSV